MKISEAQKKVDQWIKKYGVRYFNELTNTAILMEEVGEVARIVARRYGEQSEKESDKGKRLDDELADVLFVVICLANQTGIDLEKSLKKNLQKKTKRDKKRHISNKKAQIEPLNLKFSPSLRKPNPTSTGGGTPKKTGTCEKAICESNIYPLYYVKQRRNGL